MDPCCIAAELVDFDAVLLSGVLEKICSPKAPLGAQWPDVCRFLCCARLSGGAWRAPAALFLSCAAERSICRL